MPLTMGATSLPANLPRSRNVAVVRIAPRHAFASGDFRPVGRKALKSLLTADDAFTSPMGFDHERTRGKGS